MTDHNDLFRFEMLVRSHAESVRGQCPDSIKLGAGLRSKADDFDMIGNLLAGMQGCDLDTVLPMLRDGYQRLRREHEAIKDTREITEDAA